MTTPKQQENKAVKDASLKTITLSDGTKAVCHPAKGKHVRQAQKLMDGDETKMMFALIAICTDFGGKKITIEEVDELPSGDVFKLMAEYSQSSF